MPVRDEIDTLYRNESRRVFATLIRLLGDFDLAKEALHDAFKAAIEHWSRDGILDKPIQWLVSASRVKAIDGIRRQAKFTAFDDVAEVVESIAVDADDPHDKDAVQDDRLRLIFTCCHPSLAPDAQAALTLRKVCGLTTEEIAHAFLTSAPTLAQKNQKNTLHTMSISDFAIPTERSNTSREDS